MSRVLAVVAGAVLLLAGAFGLNLLVNSRDDAEVTRAQGPGEEEPDRGAEHGAAAEGGSELPTSGPHRPDLVSRDAQRLTADQVLHALELGNVVLTYPGRTPPPELRELQDAVAGPFDAELAAAGQAVVLAGEVPGEVEALAWRHRQAGTGPGDPALRVFADYWLGRGLDAGE